MTKLFTRLDDIVAQVERAVVLVFLAIMSTVVFLDVTHRVAATPDGIILRFLTTFAGDDEATRTTLGRFAVPLVCAAVTWLFIYGTLRTRRGSTIGAGKAAGLAVALTGATGLGVFLLLKLFPNGLIWSQPLALGLLLWVALLGATLAAKSRAHIVMEVADKVWPPKARRFTRLLSGVVAAGFCFALVLLSGHYMMDAVELWQMGVGNLPGLPIPKWAVYLAMPVCFTLMGLRFLGYAIGEFLAGEPKAHEVTT